MAASKIAAPTVLSAHLPWVLMDPQSNDESAGLDTQLSAAQLTASSVFPDQRTKVTDPWEFLRTGPARSGCAQPPFPPPAPRFTVFKLFTLPPKKQSAVRALRHCGMASGSGALPSARLISNRIHNTTITGILH